MQLGDIVTFPKDADTVVEVHFVKGETAKVIGFHYFGGAETGDNIDDRYCTVETADGRQLFTDRAFFSESTD